MLFFLRVILLYLFRKISSCLFKIFIQGKTRYRLENVLMYCSKHIRFYKNKGSSINNYDYMDKFTLKDNFDALYNKGRFLKETSSTSGTTGTPCFFYRDLISVISESYFQNRYFGWKNKYRIVIRADKIFIKDNKFEKIYKKIPFINEMYVSSYHLNDESMRYLVEEIKDIKNKCLWAYPSTAYILADYCIRNNVNLTFDVVATSSESLLLYQLKTIEKAFGCKVKDWYGLGERVAALYRCEYGNYHEVDGYSYVEFINKYDNVYEIVGTTYYNRVMPLVRYKTGDYVEISDKPCACGCKGKNITAILGRESDFIDLPGGRLPAVLLNVIFNKAVNIHQTQIVQKRDKSIIVKVVRNNVYTKEDDLILRNELTKLLADGQFEIQYVDSLETRKKFKFIIRE